MSILLIIAKYIAVILGACVTGLFLGYVFGMRRGIKAALTDIASAFETQHLKEGMDIIHDFLEVNFLKYIHSIMIGVANKQKFVIKGFLDESVSELQMQQKAVGFTTLTTSIMSRDLKNLFHRFYNGFNIEHEIDYATLDQYITQWFIIHIRKINAEYLTQIGEDMSMAHAMKVNSRMFISLELDLYYRLGIISKAEKTDTKVSKEQLK